MRTGSQANPTIGLNTYIFLVILGMLLRLFIAFYDLEIIEEDAFLKWKEDINDGYPGKGKALFQVLTYTYFLSIFVRYCFAVLSNLSNLFEMKIVMHIR